MLETGIKNESHTALGISKVCLVLCYMTCLVLVASALIFQDQIADSLGERALALPIDYSALLVFH